MVFWLGGREDLLRAGEWGSSLTAGLPINSLKDSSLTGIPQPGSWREKAVCVCVSVCVSVCVLTGLRNVKH